jgi:hypothetical protein
MAVSKWDLVKDRFPDIIAWLEQGFTEAQIFRSLGIGKTTWEAYKHKYSELAELLKNARAKQIVEVENSLFKNATGYYYYEEDARKVKDSEGNERLEKVTLKKFKGPETAAACFFLKNRDKKNWTDNPQLIDIRREELEIRRKTADFQEW